VLLSGIINGGEPAPVSRRQDIMATDYFIKIDGIDGDSNKKGFEKQIEIESFSFGASNMGSHATGGGGGTGKVDMQDVSLTTKMNSASPKLFLNCAIGKHIAKAVLAARKSTGDKGSGGQEVYLTWTFSDITITSFNTAGSGMGGDSIPTESFTLGFSKVDVEFKPQKPDGSLGAAVTASFDLKKMEAA